MKLPRGKRRWVPRRGWQRAIAWLTASPHPEPALQFWWNWVQVSVLLLPLSAFGGSAGLAIAAIARWVRQPRRLLLDPLSWGFAALTGLMVLSAALAPQPAAAALGLFNFLPFFGVCVALRDLLRTPDQLRRLAWIVVLGSLPVVAIGLGQFFAQWGGRVQILWLLVDWDIHPQGTPPGRMSSVWFYANVLASYLIVPFSLGLGLWFTARRQRQTVLQVWLAVALGGCATALLLTNSRNAWAIAVGVGLAFAVYEGWRWLIAAVSAVSALVLGAAFAPDPPRSHLRQLVPAFFWARLSDELYPDRPVNQLRSTQWRFAWALAQQRPWTGWGLRSFGGLYEAQTQLYLGHPHNLLLMLCAETGLPAALLLVGWVGWVVASSGRWLATARLSVDDRQIYFSYLIAFLGCTLFSTLDVTLFDVRMNALGWLLLAALPGGREQRDRAFSAHNPHD